MYKDLSLKEKAKVIREGVRLGLNSIDDILNLYDEAIGHTFQTKGLMEVDAVSGPNRLYEKDPYKSKTGYFQYWLEGRNNQLVNAAINYRKKFPLVRFRKGNSIEELTSKIKNDYLSGINNVEEYIIPFIDDWIKPQYKGFLNARVDENAKMKALNHYNTILKLSGLPETNDVNKAFLYLSNGNNGITLPDLGVIYYPETYTEALYNKNKGNSTLIHERNHAGDVANYRIQDMIFDDRVNETGRKFSYDAIRRQDYHKNGVKYDSYLDSDDEIHSRLMEFRFNNNLNPYKTYTIEEIRNMRNNKDTKDSKLFNRYNDEFMYHLLNDVAQNNTLQEELSHYTSKGGPIVTPYGQWKYPGRDTIIPSNNITMDNVNYPVLGISDTGDTKVMMPWNDYKFRGSMVYEHPLISNQFQLGGNTKPTFDLWYPTVPNQKNDTSSYDLRRAYNTLPFDEMEKFRTINDYHLPSVAYDEKTDTYTFLKRNGHPTLNYELDWYNSGNPDALEFRERYKLDTLSLPWKYIPKIYLEGGKTLNYLNVPDYNVALYNTVSPLGDFPNFLGALAYRRLVKDKLKNGNIYERDYHVGNTQGEKTAVAAWAKRLGIPYDVLDLPIYNGDTVTLPYSLVLEIPYDTSMLKNRIQLNKALLDKYSKYRYSDVVNAAIKADLYNLDKLRETYKTGKPVGLTEFGWNSRLLVNNGEILPIENIQSPLNVLGNYNVRYSPEERRLYYSDEYDFNQFENFVPGEPYRIRGYIDLDSNKALGGNLFKKGGIYINPKNKGKFNATKKRTDKTTEELTHSKNPLTRKRAIFALNARKWNHKHNEGGCLYSEGGFLLAPYLYVE